MKTLATRIAALERAHAGPRGFRGVLAVDADPDSLDIAASRAPGPGLYVHLISLGDTLELIELAKVDGRLRIVGKHNPSDPAIANASGV